MHQRTQRMREVALRFGLMDLPPLMPPPVEALPASGIVLITGPSGSGKTTLLQRLVGQIPAGRVMHLERRRLADCAVVDALDLPMEEALELLCRAGLAEAQLWLRPAAALSAGEQFRLRLALWMAQQRRPVLVADEFGNGLDRITARAVAWQLQRFMACAQARGRRRLALLATAHEDLIEDLPGARHIRLAPIRAVPAVGHAHRF